MLCEYRLQDIGSCDVQIISGSEIFVSSRSIHAGLRTVEARRFRANHIVTLVIRKLHVDIRYLEESVRPPEMWDIHFDLPEEGIQMLQAWWEAHQKEVSPTPLAASPPSAAAIALAEFLADEAVDLYSEGRGEFHRTVSGFIESAREAGDLTLLRSIPAALAHLSTILSTIASGRYRNDR